MEQFASVLTKGAQTTFEEQRERAILVGVDRPNQKWSLDSSLAELERLADTAGADTVAKTTQKLESPNPRTFVGTGKAEEIAQLARSYAATWSYFDDELHSVAAIKPRKIDKSVKIIDRTALILDIFALPCPSKEAGCRCAWCRTNILPCLRGMGASRLESHGRRRHGSRFGEARKPARGRAEGWHASESPPSSARARPPADIFDRCSAGRTMFERHVRVALAGYTNAGKSSPTTVCVTPSSPATTNSLQPSTHDKKSS